MSDAVELESVRVLRLRPGDIVVVTLRPEDQHITSKRVGALREQLQTRFPDNEVLVLNGIDLAVMKSRPEGADD